MRHPRWKTESESESALYQGLLRQRDAAMARCAQLEAALSDLMLSVMATSCRDTIVLKDISAARDALKGPR
jgi:hypothetical protein